MVNGEHNQAWRMQVEAAGQRYAQTELERQDVAQKRRRFGPLWFSGACAVLVAVAAVVFQDTMGTHRLPIHIASVVAAGAYCLVLSSREGVLQRLGLGRPRGLKWLPVLLTAGAISGVLRYELYRATGLAGVRLYEQEFVPFLQKDSPAAFVLSAAVMLGGTYLAVLVPGVLFFSVIQEPFSREGWFPLGLLIQAMVFGLIHCFMRGSFDPVYGLEAFSAAVISGVVYHRLKNVYVPAVFMSASVFTATLLSALGR